MSTLQILNCSGLNLSNQKIQFNRAGNERPKLYLFQTKAEDKYALADEMNRHYDYNLSINTWGGP